LAEYFASAKDWVAKNERRQVSENHDKADEGRLGVYFCAILSE